MNQRDRTRLERRLLAERERDLRILARLSGRADDEAEADAAHLDELDCSFLTQTSDELARIDDSLRTLYRSPEQAGKCRRCGRDIPFERLDLIPWAELCGEHQGAPSRAAPRANRARHHALAAG